MAAPDQFAETCKAVTQLPTCVAPALLVAAVSHTVALLVQATVNRLLPSTPAQQAGLRSSAGRRVEEAQGTATAQFDCLGDTSPTVSPTLQQQHTANPQLTCGHRVAVGLETGAQ